MSESVPTFAVVGHPNKGKSSIVSTLAEDDSVAVSPMPGTTTRRRAYPMRVGDVVRYVLVDTPGFQRARRALAWLRARETTAAERSAVVAAFVAEHAQSGEFPDEVELLTPVVQGAGVLYVVDGSRPLGPEYEAEMEVLRWTGAPRMALINPIGSEDYVEPWRAALGQYFSVVRVFNAMTAEFDKRVQLLRAFGQLRESWREPLDAAADALVAARREKRRAAARAIAAMVVDMLTLSVGRHVPTEGDVSKDRAVLEEQYRDRLRERERRGREDVERAYAHHGVKRTEAAVDVAGPDLFGSEQWSLFGLSRRHLLASGAAGGAVVGGVVDAGLGGASFLLGSVIGAGVGAVSALLGGQRLAQVKVMTRPLGGRELRLGPMRNVSFPYVVIGRALVHHALVAGRTHANRGELVVGGAPGESTQRHWLDALAPERRRALDKLLAGARDGDVEVTSRLAAALEPILASPGSGTASTTGAPPAAG